MNEKEKQKAAHLTILICHTFFTLALTGEAILLGWDLGAVWLLLLGLAAVWALHITKRLPGSTRLWLYFILTMLAFFFYGIHETSIYDLAPVMTFFIIMYSVTEMYSVIWLCVTVYFLTMLYDFVFVLGGSVELNSLSVTRTLLHFAVVCLSAQLVKYMMKQKTAERAQTESKIAELEEINRKTEDFLANVSHELRTPINAVTGITAVMLQNEEDEGKKMNILSIQNAGYRLFGQIEDILDSTEIDTGRIQVSEENYMISSLVNDIITRRRMTEKEVGPELIFDIDAGIPAVLTGDAKKIKKILIHLIDNACKFTPKGGIYVRIYTLEKSYGVNLCISVSDTGVGMSEEDLQRIAEKFYQSSSGRNRRAGGLGLGLSIVHGLVSAMEGFMQMESAVGSGTTVSVSIPQRVADASPGMVVPDKASLCPAVFLKPEKYESPEVRNYYNEMISNMVRGLGISLHRVFSFGELEKLISSYELTHLFIGREEYEEKQSYFEELNRSMEVIVITNRLFTLPQSSRVKLLQKPFYCFPVVSVLKGTGPKNIDMYGEKRILCPGLKVLVVDDEPMNLMVAEGIFKNYQMLVKTAESGSEAIALFEKETFDVVFLDHMMPEMDGVETLKRLRKICENRNRELIAVAFTANAVSGAREMFFREGFDEFLSKPIEASELEHVLRRVVPKSFLHYAEGDSADRGETAPLSEEETADGEAVKSPAPEPESLEEFGINIREGLHYCGEDMDFYNELLTKFAEAQEQKAKELQRCFGQEDFENYRILVHALKSTSKMIGADALSEMAGKAEEAAKNGDGTYIETHHQELLNVYRTLAGKIIEVIGVRGDPPQTDSGDGAELSEKELSGALTELKNYLDTFEADKAEAVLSQITAAGYWGRSAAGVLEEIKREVEDFELARASVKVKELIDSMERGEA